MPPTVILIRHAEAEHILLLKTKKRASNPTNTPPQDYSLHDPPLTPLGFNEQCNTLSQHLQHSFPLAQKIDLIIISPMRRTLQTAQQSLGFLIDRGIPVILRPEWQENSDKPCDTGSSISEMSQEWPQFDWSCVDPVYPKKEGLYEFSRAGLMERGRVAKEWLRGREEKVIAVVSHAGFLRVGVSYSRFGNADFRVFEFSEVEGEELELVEWEETEKKGGGLGKSERGVFSMTETDYIPKDAVVNDVAVGEVVSENPPPASSL